LTVIGNAMQGVEDHKIQATVETRLLSNWKSFDCISGIIFRPSFFDSQYL